MARNTASNAPPLRMGQGRTTRERLASAIARETRRLGHWSCGARPSMPCSNPSCLHADPCCFLSRRVLPAFTICCPALIRLMPAYVVDTGPSPRVRGEHPRRFRHLGDARTIPACAGRSWSASNIDPISSGPSPRVRGERSTGN